MPLTEEPLQTGERCSCFSLCETQRPSPGCQGLEASTPPWESGTLLSVTLMRFLFLCREGLAGTAITGLGSRHQYDGGRELKIWSQSSGFKLVCCPFGRLNQSKAQYLC